MESLIAELAGLPSWIACRTFVEDHQFLPNKLGALVARRLAAQAGTERERGAARFLQDCVRLGIAEATLQGAVNVELLEQFAASGPPEQAGASLRALATGYWTRFNEQGRPADNDAAITTARRALPGQTKNKTPAEIAELLTNITGLG